MKNKKLIIKLLFIAATHIAVAVYLYSERVVDKVNYSDLVVIFLPALAALIGYIWVMKVSKPELKMAWKVLLAIIFTAISFSIAMLIMLNTYGS